MVYDAVVHLFNSFPLSFVLIDASTNVSKDPPHRVWPKNGDVCVVYEASSAAEDDTIRCLSSAVSVCYYM